MGIIPGIGVTRNEFLDEYEYDGKYYKNYEDIPFATKKAYETVVPAVGNFAKKAWQNELDQPITGHVLKGAVWAATKTFQYIDKESMGGISGALGLLDKGMTKAADAVEYHTGLYSPTAKLGTELAVDYALTGGGGKGLKSGLKLAANKADNVATTLAKKVFPEQQLAYETVLTNDSLFRDAANTAVNTPGFKPADMFAATTIRSNLTPSTNLISEPLYDVNTTDVNRTKGGYKGEFGEYPKGIGNQGLANIMYKNIPGLKLKFGKLRSLQQQIAKHHHIEDIAFTGKWANTSDFEEVFTELNKLKIYPGDSPTNIIGMMDEGNKFLQTGKTSLIQELKKTNFPGLEKIEKYSDLLAADAPKGTKKLIDTVFKSSEYGDEFFKGSKNKLGEIKPNQMQAMYETLPDGTRIPTVLPAKEIHPEVWRTLGLDTASKEFLKLPTNQKQLLKAETWSKRWETLGVNRKNIKYDPSKMILSKDHIDTLHYKVYNSPEFIQKRQLEQMIDDKSYYKLTAKQKAEKIAEVYTIQKNASINVANNRLKLIKDYLKEAEPIRYRDMYSKDPNKLRQWIKDNNGIAANLGWYPKKGKVPDFKTLTNPDTAKITDELKIVFSTLVQ